MFIKTVINRSLTIPLTLILVLCGILLFVSCSGSDSESESETETKTYTEGVVGVTALHDAEQNRHLFELDRNEFASGWTRFEFNNASPYDHFFLIWKVPEEGMQGVGADQSLIDYWYQNITQPFQEEFNPYINGEVDFNQFTQSLVDTISTTAPWFFDPGAQTMGGPGFTAAANLSETTVYLGPGEYIVECYVKNEEEVFHSSIGMLEHMRVTEDSSEVEEPTPTTALTIASTDGIHFDQELQQGEHTVEILFEDQNTYAHLQGHNVQLVKLSDKEDAELLNSLATWMDWRQPGSLMNRAPEGAEFMGGSMEMAGGEKAYFHVDLEPGDYVWIAEIPNPAEFNMLQTFTISGESNAGN